MDKGSQITTNRNQITGAETLNSDWKNLYKLGGVAALCVVVLTLSEVGFLIFYPQPSTISGWFMLFQSNRIIGLLSFWGFEVPMYAMFVLVFLALFIALRKGNGDLMAIVLAFALLGVGIFLATNNPFTMLSLSNQHAAATTDVQRSALLAAGQAVLANTTQRAVGGFNISLFLVTIAGLITSCVMLQSTVFSRMTAYVGILANVFSLTDYVRQALTQSEVIALLVILPGALFLVIWYILVGQRLYQLGRRPSPVEL
jgi:hypothetical protein